jgi:hypothetical protein
VHCQSFPHRHRNERTLLWGIDTSIARLHFLLSTLLLKMKHDATDRFMRDFICGCYGTERFLLLHHTKYDCWPEFCGNTVFRLFWPWSPFATNRRRAGIMGFILGEQLLNLEIECASRGKEEGENWRQSIRHPSVPFEYLCKRSSNYRTSVLSF